MPSIEAQVTSDVEVEFEVFCSCGAGICSNASVRYSRSRNYPQLVVEPCEKCKQSAYNEGKEAGIEEEARRHE